MKKYCITDPSFYTSNPTQFVQKLLHVRTLHEMDFICLRDKVTQNYALLAEAFLATRPLFENTKLYLHTDFVLASKLGCDGVHLPSFMEDKIAEAKLLNLKVVFSAHSLEEALRAQNLGADAITLSPVFFTPNKGEPLGLEKLKEINDKISIKCFALGGIINDKQVRACEEVGVYGFASIRYFVE
jgi:thiamine-phosphate pyrophosphorylase